MTSPSLQESPTPGSFLRKEPQSPSRGSTVGTSELHRYIPEELMKKLQAAREKGGMVGERRVVTMLFCDLKGSTAAAEGLDPEDWTEIMNGAFAQMIKPVYQYEGTIARLMGDALLAFFGAPIAHEDDPRRAILAGLDIVEAIKPYREQIRESYGVDFDIRVGINTGLVVVGAVGSDLRMEYSALGDAINLAARMEQTAEPGTVRVAHDTYKLVKNLFEFESLGGVAVKGKSEPVLAYQALGRKFELGRTRGIEGLHAAMVGRDAELAALRQAMADLKQGLGRIVFVLGEAGLGKTRLISEAHEVFQTLGHIRAIWVETISLSYETNQAYGLFQRLIRRVGGIDYNDAPPVLRERLSALVEILDETRRSRALHVFEALFGLEREDNGIPIDDETFKRELLEAMVLWWKARFSLQSAVLVFDDMHWCDSASAELLRQLLPLTGESPLVLLFAMRAERNAPAWQIKTTADEEYNHRYTELALHPLSDLESNELLNRLLADPDLPGDLRASILEKSGGNPFFIEEVVRTLIDNGVLVPEEHEVHGAAKRIWRATGASADFAIPDNLQSLLAARMDRLEESTRGTLQLASVIGRSFYHRVLQAVDEASHELDKHIGTLLRMELIREAARLPEIEYAFRNPLTQEAVYKTILIKRRRTFHQRVGEAMESIYADRLDGLFGLLAYHFALAHEQEKAIDYYRKAARQAVALFAYDDAIQNLRSALKLIEEGKQTETHGSLLEELGDVYRLLRDIGQAIAIYHDSLHLWETLPDADKTIAVRLHRKIVQLATESKWNVDLDTYRHVRDHTLESLNELESSLSGLRHEPEAEVVRALATLSFEAWRSRMPPDWERAQRFAQAAADMAEELAEPVVLSRALGALGNVLDGRSLLRDHLQVALRRLEVSQDRRVDDLIERIDAVSGAGMALMYVGEYEQAIPYLQEAEALALRAQSIGQQTAAIGLQSQCAFRLDRWDEVIALEDKWRDLERRFPRQRVGPTCFSAALSGSVHALRGDIEKSRAYGKESVDYMISMSGSPEIWQRNQFY
ncbi:MAG TPA: adenylate/guanylate cyclase domain-containing protein [Anaerolineales bacterium]|nr:adenylate/guanylate cyclase domain-containing protein [Anaerolineales bacterium]